MEAYFGWLESELAGIPLAVRRVCILASRKLMAGIQDKSLALHYTSTLRELFASTPDAARSNVHTLQLCIEAYGRTFATLREKQDAI